MRPVFVPTNNNIENSFFAQQVPAESLKWNKGELERSFRQKEQASNSGTSTPSGGGATAATSSQAAPSKTRVLDFKNSQMLAIQFGQLPEPIRLAGIISSLDKFPECLPSQGVLALHAAMREQDTYIQQIRELKVPDSDLSKLDLPERFLWVLGSVPMCSAKLACGALIVREAREIEDLRHAGQRVCTFCQQLKESKLIRSCITNSLDICNFMNRGTSRVANGLWLPEALLRLDECRGNRDANEDRALSLLDFVARTVAQGEGSLGYVALGEEARQLMLRAKEAQGVPLEDVETNVNKVCAQALGAKQVLEAEMLKGQLNQPQTPSAVGKLAQRVYSIYEEANSAAGIVGMAKEDYQSVRSWYPTKMAKIDEWLSGWATFLDQLSQALSRLRPKQEVMTVQRLPSSRAASPAPQARNASPAARLASSSSTPALAPGTPPKREKVEKDFQSIADGIPSPSRSGRLAGSRSSSFTAPQGGAPSTREHSGGPADPMVRRLRDSSLAGADQAGSPSAAGRKPGASPGKQSDVSDWEDEAPAAADAPGGASHAGADAGAGAGAFSPPARRRLAKMQRPPSPDSDEAPEWGDSPR